MLFICFLFTYFFRSVKLLFPLFLFAENTLKGSIKMFIFPTKWSHEKLLTSLTIRILTNDMSNG